jgi:hypothetical protein
MNRQEAMRRANSGYGTRELNGGNTRFANINSPRGAWWVDIPLSKITAGGLEEINLLLYDHRSDELHHLRVPSKYFRENITWLAVLEDKDCIRIELTTDRANMFKDIRSGGAGVQFVRFRQRVF